MFPATTPLDIICSPLTYNSVVFVTLVGSGILEIVAPKQTVFSFSEVIE